MGKKWIVVLFILAFGTLATVAQAGQYMVVVIDVAEKANMPKVKAVYDASGMEKIMKGVSFVAERVHPKPLGETLAVNGKPVVAIPEHTVIFTESSPGCVTYTQGGYSWTVCN